MDNLPVSLIHSISLYINAAFLLLLLTLKATFEFLQAYLFFYIKARFSRHSFTCSRLCFKNINITYYLITIILITYLYVKFRHCTSKWPTIYRVNLEFKIHFDKFFILKKRTTCEVENILCGSIPS